MRKCLIAALIILTGDIFRVCGERRTSGAERMLVFDDVLAMIANFKPPKTRTFASRIQARSRFDFSRVNSIEKSAVYIIYRERLGLNSMHVDECLWFVVDVVALLA